MVSSFRPDLFLFASIDTFVVAVALLPFLWINVNSHFVSFDRCLPVISLALFSISFTIGRVFLVSCTYLQHGS